MSGTRCPMCDYDTYDCQCEDRIGKHEAKLQKDVSQAAADVLDDSIDAAIDAEIVRMK